MDREGGDTLCHACGAKLIGRDGYILTDWNLDEGRCGVCLTPCAGVFEEEPGLWGARRVPVRLKDFAA